MKNTERTPLRPSSKGDTSRSAILPTHNPKDPASTSPSVPTTRPPTAKPKGATRKT